MKILAIIPARGGSKRLPGKNIKVLNGKPLVQWTIESAIGVDEVKRVVVSTDSQEIADISMKAGAEVPFLRPGELATDTSSTSDVIKHTLDFYKNIGEEYDFILLLQPTSPLRNVLHNKQAIELLKSKRADAVVSLCECEHSPLWANTLADDLSMNNFIRDELKATRSQDLPKYYRLNGAIYLSRVTRFYQEKSLFLSSNIYGYKMNNESSVDIDHELDFLLAETIFKYRKDNA